MVTSLADQENQIQPNPTEQSGSITRCHFTSERYWTAIF